MSLRRESGREPTERVGPRRGREQKLGGHQALSLKSIAFWEAHLSGALSVTLAGRRVNEPFDAVQWNTRASPNPQPSAPVISAHSARPLTSDFPGNPASRAVWELRPFPTIVPVPGHHSLEASPAWQPPHLYSCAPPTPCPGLRKPKELI